MRLGAAKKCHQTPGSGARLDLQLSVEPLRDLVHPLLRHGHILRDAEQAEDARTLMLMQQVAGSRNDVDVNVRMILMLCELDDVGLIAVDDFLNSSRYLFDQRTQLSGLVHGHVRNSGDVATNDEDDPTFDRCAERVDDVPVWRAPDPIPRRCLTLVSSLHQLAGPALRHTASLTSIVVWPSPNASSAAFARHFFRAMA